MTRQQINLNYDGHEIELFDYHYGALIILKSSVVSESELMGILKYIKIQRTRIENKRKKELLRGRGKE